MSYEPTLIIVREDLHKKERLILEGVAKAASTRASESAIRRNAAFRALEGYLDHDGHKVRGVALIMVRPELSIHNRTVRELLHELNIEFAAYD